MLYFSILLHCIDLTSEFLWRVSAKPFTFLSSYFCIGDYRFRPNWPSSGVQVVVADGSTSHCNAVLFPPMVVAGSNGIQNHNNLYT
jgi:hypothetical protein